MRHSFHDIMAMQHLLALCSIGLLGHLSGRGTQVAGYSQSVSVSATERESLILAINSVRRRVEPTAANMMFVVWNSYLEKTAQRWADECDYEAGQPSFAMNKPDGRVLTAFHAMESTYSIDTALKAWYAQESHFDHEAGSCRRNDSCSHYVALVLAMAQSVGCGIARCRNGSTLPYTFVVACNFGVPGNVAPGGSPYATGAPCSACPAERPTCERKLCRQHPMCGDTPCPADADRDPASCECLASPAVKASAQIRLSLATMLVATAIIVVIVVVVVLIIVQHRKYRTSDWLQDGGDSEDDDEDEGEEEEEENDDLREEHRLPDAGKRRCVVS